MSGEKRFMLEPNSAFQVRNSPLPFTEKLGYATGQTLDSIVQHALGIFLLFYATSVCGVPGALAGSALAAGLVVDAFLDPLIGTASDGWRSPWGRRLPFMAAALPLVAIFFILIFSLPRGLAPTVLFLWLTMLSIALRISLSLFILPYQAVGAELSDDYAERSSIAAWRWGIGMIGTVGAVLLGFGYFFAGPGGLSNRDAYPPFAISLSIVVIVFSLISMRAIRQGLPRLHAPAVTDKGAHRRVFVELAEVLRNRTFRILLVGALLFFSGLGTNMALGLHANTYFWKLTTAQIQGVTLAIFVGLVLGAPIAGPMLKLMEKRTVLLIGMAGLGVADFGPAALRLFGLLPLNGSELAIFISVVKLIGGMLMASAAIAFASMMADAADEHEHLFSARREGLYFAGWAFASKAATGLGTLVAGLVLQLIGFPSGMDAQGAATVRIPEHVANLLGAFYGPGAGLLYVGAILVTFLYELDSRRHAAILEELSVRRSKIGEAKAIPA
jgi:GPH family glycoside/pentoside/hexuronide:cation symporter